MNTEIEKLLDEMELSSDVVADKTNYIFPRRLIAALRRALEGHYCSCTYLADKCHTCARERDILEILKGEK